MIIHQLLAILAFALCFQWLVRVTLSSAGLIAQYPSPVVALFRTPLSANAYPYLKKRSHEQVRLLRRGRKEKKKHKQEKLEDQTPSTSPKPGFPEPPVMKPNELDPQILEAKGRSSRDFASSSSSSGTFDEEMAARFQQSLRLGHSSSASRSPRDHHDGIRLEGTSMRPRTDKAYVFGEIPRFAEEYQ